MDIVHSCRLRDLLEALMFILPMQFGHLHSCCSGPAQNIENFYCIARMEAANGGKDLNVSATVPAIELFPKNLNLLPVTGDYSKDGIVFKSSSIGYGRCH
nr:3-hydroxy-3-methylglutaryl-coenzyme A reductase 1 [Tanacetum cinerariifolium]